MKHTYIYEFIQFIAYFNPSTHCSRKQFNFFINSIRIAIKIVITLRLIFVSQKIVQDVFSKSATSVTKMPRMEFAQSISAHGKY